MEKSDHLGLTGKQLSLFLAVYDTNSISRAAEQLGLNQSTVSYSLERLRELFGDPLFVKSGRGIAPTERAIALVPAVRSVSNSLESLCQIHEFDPARETARITVAANVMEMLPNCRAISEAISATAPQANLSFLELGSRENIKDMLNSSAVDAIISIRPVRLANSLNSEPLATSELVCFYDPDCRGPVISVDDFAAANHATLDFGGQSRSTIDTVLHDLSLTRNVKLRAPNPFALGYLMAGTDCIATMQKSLADSAFAGFSYSQPPIKLPSASIDLIWHKRSDTSAKSMWLRDQIKSAFK